MVHFSSLELDTIVIRLVVISYCRQWVVRENQFVLTGIVAGNPTGFCDRRVLPDVYNSIKVIRYLEKTLSLTIGFFSIHLK